MEITEVEEIGVAERLVPTFSGEYFNENAYDGLNIEDSLDVEGQGVITQID